MCINLEPSFGTRIPYHKEEAIIMNSVTKNFVDVDVSKNWLDVYIHPKNQTIRVDNTKIGLNQLFYLS